MTRLDAIRRRLEAATPGPWTCAGGRRTQVRGSDRYLPIYIMSDSADGDLVLHAPEDLSDLLAVCDLVRRTFIPAYLVAFGPDGTLKFHVDQKDLRAIWDAFATLDAPVGDEGN